MSPARLRPDHRTTRRLRLCGGSLDGTAVTADIDVGGRIDCGTGEWSPDNVYVVTSQTVRGPDGSLETVAVPASF